MALRGLSVWHACYRVCPMSRQKRAAGEQEMESLRSLVSAHIFMWTTCSCCQSRRPCGLRRRSAAARLLGLWVRIPPGAWMSVVSVVCCQVEVSATGWSLVQRSPTDCGASCVTYLVETPRMRMLWLTGGPQRHGGKKFCYNVLNTASFINISHIHAYIHACMECSSGKI